MSADGRVQRLERPDGNTVAYARTAGRTPTVVFLGGFRSDMTGTKALFLDDYCRRRGAAYLRFDYFGHGASSGDFALGTIGRTNSARAGASTGNTSCQAFSSAAAAGAR